MKPSLDKAETQAGRPEESLGEFFHSWRHFFRLLGLLLSLVLLYSEENWRGQRAWVSYKHRLETQGVRFDLASVVPPGVADSENFAQALLSLPNPSLNRSVWSPALAHALNHAPRATHASGGTRSNSWVWPQADLAAWYAAFLAGTNGTARHQATNASAANWTRQEGAAGVLAALSETDGPLEELRAASRRPHSRFSIDYNKDNPWAIPLPHLSAFGRVNGVLQIRASAELALGRTAEAFEDVQLMLKILDACREEPFLVSQWVRAEQLPSVLQVVSEGLGQWSEPQLQVLQKRLGEFDFCADARRTLEADYVVFGVKEIDYYRRGSRNARQGLAANQQRQSEFVDIVFSAVPSGWFGFEAVNYCKEYQEYMAPILAGGQHRVNVAAARKAEDWVESLNRSSWPRLVARHQALSQLLAPWRVLGIVHRMAFAQEGADLAGLGCALERYRLAKGGFPDTLEALAPGFMNTLPRDVINGQTLAYRRTADGQYVIYSVGWNEKDDGGRAVFPKDSERADEPEGDWVWRPAGGE